MAYGFQPDQRFRISLPAVWQEPGIFPKHYKMVGATGFEPATASSQS